MKKRDRLREAVEGLADEWRRRKEQAEKLQSRGSNVGVQWQAQELAENYAYFERALRAVLADDDIDQREESANGGSTERAEGEVGAGFRAA